MKKTRRYIFQVEDVWTTLRGELEVQAVTEDDAKRQLLLAGYFPVRLVSKNDEAH